MTDRGPIDNEEGGATSVPPHSVESEQYVLGALMQQPAEVSTVADRLQADDFYRKAHQRIFDALVDMQKRSTVIDMTTVSSELKHRGLLDMVGGRQYITDLAMSIASTASAGYHVDRIIELSTRRKTIKLAVRSREKAFDVDEDSGRLLADLIKEATDLSQRAGGRRSSLLADIMNDVEQRVQYRYQHQNELPGIDTGLIQLNELTGGWLPGINIVAGRPSMGKTQFILKQAHQAAAVQGIDVLIASLEMSRESLGQRWWALCSQMDQKKLKFGRLNEPADWPRLYANLTLDGAAARTHILDTKDDIGTVGRITKHIRLLEQQQRKPKLLIIDHLQLLHTEQEMQTKNYELDLIGEELRALAAREDLAIILLQQLNRKCEERGDKRPLLGDLRDSGSCEQHADLVVMLYRDEYYNKDTDAKGEAELIIRKQRDGELGTATVGFRGSTGEFICMGLDKVPTATAKEERPRYSNKRKNGDTTGAGYKLPGN